MLEAGTEVPTSNKMCQTTQECMHLEKHLEGNILLLCAKQVWERLRKRPSLESFLAAELHFRFSTSWASTKM
jgi:hypothetical protein